MYLYIVSSSVFFQLGTINKRQQTKERDYNVKTKTVLLNWWSKSDLLFWFLVVWSLIQYSMCWIEFAKLDHFKVPSEMPYGYLVILGMYALRKEAKRWLEQEQKKRKGEVFFYIWWYSLLGMLVIEFYTHDNYSVPKRMLETCISISIPFVITAISKLLHQARANKKQQRNGSRKKSTNKQRKVGEYV